MPESKSRVFKAPAASKSATDDNLKRRKNVGTACLACKARKLKCTGEPPCANCIKSRLECNLDETTDKRRRGALKRKIDQLEDKEGLLIRLMEVLRDTSDRRTGPLLNLIRSNASLPEIQFYIEHELPRSDSTLTPELTDIWDAVKQRQPWEPLSERSVRDIQQPSEIPCFSVPAQPWTSIVADNNLVSHLISLWFTWVHPFCNWIDRDLFIRDMQAGSLSATFCSQFLVNIILADACAYSDYPEVYGVPGDLTSKGSHFYEQAKRLLDKEEGRISLPTVQGLGVLWMCASITGRDRQEWICRGQLAYSLQELSEASAKSSSQVESDIPVVQVIHDTNWGLFNLSMIHALSDTKGPAVKLPQTPRIPSNHESDKDRWHAYPHPHKDVASHAPCLFNALCNLHQITYSLRACLFAQSESPHERLEVGNGTLDAIRELSLWAGRLPKCLNDTAVDMPHVVSLHVYYHTIMMTIYRVLNTQPSCMTATNHDAIISPVHAQEVCLSSARHIAHLTQIYHSRWGLDRMPGINIHWIMAALLTLLETLDDPASRAAFISLTVAARALSRRWEPTRGLFHTIQTTAQQYGVLLPAEIQPLFVDPDQGSTSSTQVRSEISETSMEP
ncbi:hypothetical protein ARAM_003168 [Aspergillus rambellii]|uniref:Zn(2)-C6 fungal-type domain-containing protein n=2 Tax=Aspergillus subgen. Nidulantes TaxID=2720870 RepID=A0A0F8WY58_9EURO|nr:hypothetical protein ARAM_003168 [Aspergillus rambellii]KKK19441.1 hypothetical protein AOCH_001318 [Aspergillus ochraceoroseus]